MKKLIIPFITLVAVVSLLLSLPKQDDVNFNDYVINTIAEYENNGTLPYSWVSGYEGVTKNLSFKGEVIARANPDSSHSSYCCGLTFEVYYKSLMRLIKDEGMKNALDDMTVKDMGDFMSIWFVQEVKGDGPGLALEKYGLGYQIDDMKNVKKGDFVQIWRTSGSGHSVIFMNWTVNDAGDTTGMRYWSTQPGTNGVNYNTEYFSEYGGRVDKAHTYFSRGWEPEDFKDY
jgi:hypothetical protein